MYLNFKRRVLMPFSLGLIATYDVFECVCTNVTPVAVRGLIATYDVFEYD